MKLKKFVVYSITLLAFGIVLLGQRVYAQNDIVSGVKAAMEVGNARALVRHFNTIVELDIKSDRALYNKIQAEGKLRDFFKEQPPLEFMIIHSGSGGQGLEYVIANYTSVNGDAFRCYFLIKNIGGRDVIDQFQISQ